MSDFRERLQQAANYAGVGDSQATIAASLGLNRQTIHRWFSGGEPNSEMLLHIARAWGVSAEWLQSGKGEMHAKPGDGLSAEERELVRHYRSASPQIRDVIRTMTRAVRKTMIAVAVVGVPPLMAPTDADADILHNQNCASVFDVIRERITDCIAKLASALRNVRQHFASSFQDFGISALSLANQ